MRWPFATALSAVLLPLSAGSFEPEGSGVFLAAASPPEVGQPNASEAAPPGAFVPPVKRSKPTTPPAPTPAEGVPLPEHKPESAAERTPSTAGSERKSASKTTRAGSAKRSGVSKRRLADGKGSRRK